MVEVPLAGESCAKKVDLLNNTAVVENSIRSHLFGQDRRVLEL
jgi:hypothetical protein